MRDILQIIGMMLAATFVIIIAVGIPVLGLFAILWLIQTFWVAFVILSFVGLVGILCAWVFEEAKQ